MESVFLVHHIHVFPDDSENIKIIGIYRSKDAAAQAIERVKMQPGFVDYPHIIDLSSDEAESGFTIDEYVLDKDNWQEGYVTV
jgi:hypothetical protein